MCSWVCRFLLSSTSGFLLSLSCLLLWVWFSTSSVSHSHFLFSCEDTPPISFQDFSSFACPLKETVLGPPICSLYISPCVVSNYIHGLKNYPDDSQICISSSDITLWTLKPYILHLRLDIPQASQMSQTLKWSHPPTNTRNVSFIPYLP